MKKIYERFCKIEEGITNFLLILIACLVFLGAVGRTLKHPLNWAGDIALLAFAWQVFLGGDLAIRNTKLVGIDMFVKNFPKVIQKWMSIVFSIIIIIFLGILAYYGMILVMDSTQRLMNTLTISYAWCTLAVPVGAFLMGITMIIKVIESIKIPLEEWES